MGSQPVNIILTLVASAMLAGYLLYGIITVPSGIQQQDHVIWVFAKRKYVRGLSIAGEYLGLGHRLNHTRYLATLPAFRNDFHVETEGIQIRNTEFDGVPVRLYEPDNKVADGPALIWIHGGGWTTKHTESDDFLVVHLAKRLGIIAVSIEYRLAPEHLFPAAFEDCEKATAYFIQNAKQFGVDPKRIALSGASAGGNLAAAVALKFRDDKRPYQVEHQVLLVPCLQALDFNTPSYQMNAYDPFLPKYWMISFWFWYALGANGHRMYDMAWDNGHTSSAAKTSKHIKLLDHNLVHRKYIHNSYTPNANDYGNSAFWEKHKGIFLNPYFAPLMAENLKGLPPAYIATAHYDVLRDDGILYARRLEGQGNRVVLKHYEDGFHAQSDFFQTLNLSKRVIADLIAYLSKNL